MSSAALVPVNIPRSLAELPTKTPALFLPNAKAAERFFDYFTSHIRNKNTRRACYITTPCASLPNGARARE